VGDKALISSDRSILSAAELHGIPILPIKEGNVALPPYTHGFIGGATGFDDGKLFFAGDLSLHPDGKRIEDFCKIFDVEPISLAKCPLSDIGTILFI
jgi:hypothetical protein